MKAIDINLSSFTPEKQAMLREKISALAWEDFFDPEHPEILSIDWDASEPFEAVFPELVPFITYR